MARDKETNLTVAEIKLELIDRVAPYDIKAGELISYETEVRALLSFPEKERRKRLNMLVDKIRSQHRVKGD